MVAILIVVTLPEEGKANPSMEDGINVAEAIRYLEQLDKYYSQIARPRNYRDGRIKQLYSRNQFSICQQELISIEEVLNIDTTLRSVATAQSCSNGQGFKKCSCKKKMCNVYQRGVSEHPRNSNAWDDHAIISASTSSPTTSLELVRRYLPTSRDPVVSRENHSETTGRYNYKEPMTVKTPTTDSIS
ncbi:hypothetical protein TNCV_2931541 [Trichonephila clavipes]|nr:hypothetical protein TNCV_2931541 [Trichonephila clavipes]